MDKKSTVQALLTLAIVCMALLVTNELMSQGSDWEPSPDLNSPYRLTDEYVETPKWSQWYNPSTHGTVITEEEAMYNVAHYRAAKKSARKSGDTTAFLESKLKLSIWKQTLNRIYPTTKQ